MKNTVQEKIVEIKEALANSIQTPMAVLSDKCARVWSDIDQLDTQLAAEISTIPACQVLYAWDINAIEISSLVTKEKFDRSWRGKDLSQRPYLQNHLPFKGIMLSSVYQSITAQKLCITALQAVRQGNDLLGFIAADFAVNDFLTDNHLLMPKLTWQQFRGDPAVRGTVFMQERVASLADTHIEEVNDLMASLICDHGVFHCKLHYSSSRCSIWLLDDPYNYRLHGVDEIINPDICLAYPLRKYPQNAKISYADVRKILEELKALRYADETIYLRSSSINIMNGLVGLTFSCDGSHYMPAEEFLEKKLSFWLGTLSNT